MAEREFDARVEKLEEVMAFVEENLDEASCPMKQAMQIAVSVEEIFVNVAHYAYRNAPEPGTVIVSVAREGDIIIIGFVDRGMPFNPLDRDDPDVTLSADDRKIGGLGIYMVKQSMDDVRYTFEDGKNMLELRKRI